MNRSVLFLILALVLLTASPGRAQSAPPAWVQAQLLGSAGTVSFTGQALDARGNTYITGTFQSPLTLAPGTVLTSAGGTDSFLAKYTPAGTLDWVLQAGGPNADRIAGVAVDGADNAYIVGDFTSSLQLSGSAGLQAGVSTSNSSSHLFMAALTPQGRVMWLRQDGSVQAGITSGNCTAAGIGLDATGNIYVAGTLSGGPLYFGGLDLTGSTTTAARDYFVVKYQVGTSNAQWARQGGRAAFVSGQTTYVPTLLVAPPGDAYLVGTFAPGTGAFGSLPLPAEPGGFDVAVVKYSALGAEQWERRSGGAGFDRARFAALDGSGRLAVAAEFGSAATFGGQALVGTGTRSAALMIYAASTGAEQWAKVLTGTTLAYYGDVVADAAGNFYAAGTFDGVGAAGGAPLTSAGGTDAVVVSYTPQGVFRWQQQSASPANEMAFSIRLDNAQHLRVGGSFVGTAQFGPGISLASQGGANVNVFLAQLATLPLAVYGAQTPQVLVCYPNPAHGAVGLAPLPARTSVVVIDALGRTVYTLANAGASLHLEELVPGIYQVLATAPNGQRWTNKLLVE